MDMKKVRVTNVLSGRFNTTITLEYSHDYFQLLDPQEIALAVEYYLNKDQTKPKINIDEITKAARDYGNILIHKGNQYNKDMKDNLLPFDLEEAKKDPSRVRLKNGDKPLEVIFPTKAKQVLVITIDPDGAPTGHTFDFYGEFDLRLTPKRRFVKEYRDYDGDTYYRPSEETVSIHWKLLGTYELIPVKEDE